MAAIILPALHSETSTQGRNSTKAARNLSMHCPFFPCRIPTFRGTERLDIAQPSVPGRIPGPALLLLMAVVFMVSGCMGKVDYEPIPEESPPSPFFINSDADIDPSAGISLGVVRVVANRQIVPAAMVKELVACKNRLSSAADQVLHSGKGSRSASSAYFIHIKINADLDAQDGEELVGSLTGKQDEKKKSARYARSAFTLKDREGRILSEYYVDKGGVEVNLFSDMAAILFKQDLSMFLDLVRAYLTDESGSEKTRATGEEHR